MEEVVNHKISERVWKIIACPYCGTSLHNSDRDVTCSNCQSQYRYTKSGTIDLRLQRQKKYRYDFLVGTQLLPESEIDFGILSEKPNPEVDFSQHAVPYNLTRELLSYFPRAKTDHSLMLDLGCGNTVHKEVCEYAGFEYVGLDYDSDGASMLGDAHALPFKDESFEFILCTAVLEHIRFPFVAMKEACRVLKPNGMFIGTVAFLEPFHRDSYYHHTHLGTYNSLREGGFYVEKICSSDKWSVLMAQASMVLFPKMPRVLSRLLVMPVQIMHKVWWRLGSMISNEASEDTRVRKTTGAFTFITHK
jgi:SAM-dependent methyltransferase